MPTYQLFGTNNVSVSYTHLDVYKRQELVKRDYECISGKIMEMQIALDRYNQTFLFEADI